MSENDNIRKEAKNPYQYNGESLVLPADLPPSTKDSSSEQWENKSTHKKVYIETYGCQMNFSDSEIIASILNKNQYRVEAKVENADLILLNTCSIRAHAEKKIFQRIRELSKLKKQNPSVLIGILGCMAERLKSIILEKEKWVDLVAGPDAYHDLPHLIQEVQDGRKAINVLLSREETYADISPIRLNSNGVTAFVSIMRGCDNMCSFCVVPFTRGRERSRSPESIMEETKQLADSGFKEITLLGQNVDSYKWKDHKGNIVCNFAQLLAKVAKIAPWMRIRFSTSHPKDMTDDVLYAIAEHENICNYIHLPVQSGNDRILDLMKRGYTKQWYLERIKSIRKLIPACGISTDIITGFCSETDSDHLETLSLMDEVIFDFAYMFKYSQRPGTYAARKLQNDVSQEVKGSRLSAIIEKQKKHSLIRMKEKIGRQYTILVEGLSKKDKNQVFGRTSENAVVIIDKEDIVKGDYVQVKISSCTSATLFGTTIKKIST